MFKKATGILKLAAAVILICIMSIWTTGYIVTHYLDTLLKQFNVPFDMKPVAVSGVWGSLWGANPPLKDAAGQEGTLLPEDSSTLEEEAGQDALGVFGQQNIESTENVENIEKEKLEEGLDPLIDGSESSLHIDETQTALSTDELTAMKDKISSEDKNELLQMIAGKLPQEVWQEISQYAEDGITDEELTAIQQLLAMHLDKEEYTKMIEILSKY